MTTISETFLARLRESAEALTLVDPFLTWGVAAYAELWELGDTDDLVDGRALAFEPGDGPAPSQGDFAGAPSALHAFLGRAASTVGEGVPGDPALDVTYRIYVCVRRAVELAEDIAVDVPGVRPAGVAAVAVGSAATAWVDVVTLEVVDVGGRLVGLSLDGEPDDAGFTPRQAIAALAAAALSLADHLEQHDVETAAALPTATRWEAALALLQRADALAAPSLDLVVDRSARAGAVDGLRSVTDAIDEVGFARIAIALEELAATTEEGLGTVAPEACRALRAAIVDADARVNGGALVRTAIDAHERLARRVVEEAVEASDSVYTNALLDLDDTVQRAKEAARSAAVLARRGQSARRSWRQAERRWATLDPVVARACADRSASAGTAPSVLTFDAAIGITGTNR
ncbi:MAG: hypothetical protein JWN67_1133 [Actinomycetia bacterium]|nr:hypothetical protein [Actinomycetes bacterium]